MKRYDEFVRHLSILRQAREQDLTNTFIVSGIIEKFFIQFELGWKLLKELLREEGRSISASCSPRAIIKEAYLCFDFLSEDVWLDMLHARNDLTHIYNSTRAEEMVREILTRYIPAFDAMEQGLREQNGEPISHEG